MALKRKASFSDITSPNVNPFAMASAPTFNDTPRHLHSRTRKRFRNDRPDDQTVYQNTLRLLFSGQKQPVASMMPSLEETSLNSLSESEMSDTEIRDPRQQTLRRFFAPTQPSSSMDMATVTQNVSTVCSLTTTQNSFPDTDVSGGSVTSGSTTPYSEEMQMDVPMDMGANNGLSISTGKTWVGGIGWM